ncbi:unnamed protein product [Rotaria sordida]|uniref:OCIA domain-containing protein n=1 Tax=Rotaria sordida TaxID=392033 RepID=A0A814NPN6_9BILA|nr:unnamed protein product [Rotaria sordida]CAF3635423.1 unnamed protein product [Rotaria sordida]
MSTSIQPPKQLNRDETRILEECEQESLIYRSLPLSICSFFAIQYAIYMIGKFSYALACQKKILMKIPDSNLAKMIRGVENRQISNIDNVNNYKKKQTNDLNEAVIFESDTHLTSVGTNQYGDPIYKTNK